MRNEFERALSIWTGDSDTPNQYACFYAGFTYDGGDLTLVISAESHYAVYVNGEYVYAAQYADYPFERVYDEIDISAQARRGENALKIIGYCANRDFSVGIKHAPYVRFEVFSGGASIAHSGAHTRCAPCAQYMSGDMELISPQLGYTFKHDATRADAPASSARLVEYAGVSFSPRPVRQCALGARRETKLISQGAYIERAGAETLGERMQTAYLGFREPTGERDFELDEGDGLYLVYDLGEETAGLIDIELTLDERAEVLIGWGEHVHDLRVRASVGGRNFCASYTAPAGRHNFVYPFRRVGARYIQLHINSRRARVDYAGVRPVVYPLGAGGRLTLDDALEARIYEVCVRTLRACMHEHYEDCPWREQALYAMDSRNQMLAGYYAFGEYDFAKASLALLKNSLRADGLLELCAPAKVPVNIPSFSAMFVVALWEYLKYSGDLEFAREALPVSQIVTDTFISCARPLIPAFNSSGDWNFYEWSPGLDGQLNTARESARDELERRYDAPLQAFAILAADSLANILSALGDNERARVYSEKAAALKASAHTEFYDGELERYHTYSRDGVKWGAHELTQALMLYSGACPDAAAPGVARALASGGLTPVTLAYTVFKYEALLASPREYAAWVRRDIQKLWGDMLACGATSFWETEKGEADFDRAGSLCHGWSAIPAYLYFAYGAGVKPGGVGWAQIIARPLESFARVNGGEIITRDGRVIVF